MLRASIALLVVSSFTFTACALVPRRFTVMLDELEAHIESGVGAFSLASSRAHVAHVVEARVAPAEPWALRRRLIQAGARWGEDGAWLRQVIALYRARLDVEALPRDASISVWTLGEHVVAAEIHRAQEHGGPLIALPAFRDKQRQLVGYFDEHGISLDGDYLAKPVDYRYIASGYGPRVHPLRGKLRTHRGLDMSARQGEPVISVGPGVVVAAATNAGAGNFVVIKHGNGLRSKYFHLDAFAEGLKAGQRVVAGQLIGTVGMTGNATGPHLHFEVTTKWGRTLDPALVDWPGRSRLSKKQRAEHKQLVEALRAMQPDELLFTWPTAPPKRVAPAPKSSRTT